MVLCFCNSPSGAALPSGAEQHLPHPVSTWPALPAAPPPAKLPRPRADSPPGQPRTPQRPRRQQSASPQTGSGHCPIPKIPDFEGLAESETDSDDELLQLTRMRAAAGAAAASGPNPSTPRSAGSGGGGGGGGGGVFDSAAMSPLSSLISRIGSIGRGSPTKPASHHCATPESAKSTDDLAAAAHRAEVRRLTHKMMQEELHKDRQSLASRAYKRSTMSTIREDPSDLQVHKDPGSQPAAALDENGPRPSIEYAVVRSSADLSVPVAVLGGELGQSSARSVPEPGSPTKIPARSLSLQGSKVGLPQGLGIRGRVRGVRPRGLKDWMRSSPAPVPPAPRPEPDDGDAPTVQAPPSTPTANSTESKADSSGSSGSQKSKEETPIMGGLNITHATADDTPREEGEAAAGSRILCSRFRNSQAISDSISSMDEDGSIHEARKARVVMSGRLCGSSSLAGNRVDAAYNTVVEAGRSDRHAVDPAQKIVSCTLQPAASQRAKHARGSSASSHISSLDLPPPLIGSSMQASSERHGPAVKGQTAGSSTAKEGTAVAGNHSQTLPSRKGFAKFQFTSLSRLNFVSALKKAADAEQALKSKPGSATSESPSVSNKLRSQSASGATLGSPPGDQANLQDCRSTRTVRQNSSSANLPTVQGHALRPTARSLTADLEQMAEEWHRELDQLRLGGAPHSKYAGMAVPPASLAARQRRRLSNTWPPTYPPKSSGVGDLWWIESLATPGQTAPAADRNQPSQHGSRRGIQDVSHQLGCRRHSVSLDARDRSETWWLDYGNAPAIHDTTNSDARVANPANPDNRSPGDASVKPQPSSRENTTRLSEPEEEAPIIHHPPAEATAPKGFSAGLEKAILAGIKRVMSRKQESPPVSSPPVPDAALVPGGPCQQTASVVKKQDAAKETDHSKNAFSPEGKSGELEQRVAPPNALLAAATAVDLLTGAAEAASSRHSVSHSQVSDCTPDIDSVFRVLIDIGNSEDADQSAPEGNSQGKNGGAPAPEEGGNSPASVPSTPVTHAYAEVEAFISNAFPRTQATGHAVQGESESPSSSYRDAVSQHGTVATHLSSSPAMNRKSLDAFSLTGDVALPYRQSPGGNVPPSKFMTWNGRAKPKQGPLKSTVQFSAELETVFRGKKENRKALEDRTFRPIVGHD